MMIMGRNEPLCDIDRGTGEVRTLHGLPYGLFLEQGDDFDTRLNNRANFEHWCASRVLSLDREYAKQILNAAAFSQGATDRERADTALQYRCLSLQDFYWVRMGEETWEEVNLFQNSLGNGVVDIALRGKSLTVTNAMMIAPDCSTSGLFPKAWVRRGEGFYLYKGDRNDSVRKEVEASKILQKLGIPVLDYAYDSWEGQEVSSCRCFTSENIGFVTAEAYVSDHSLGDRIDENYYTMNLADYLVGNTDRHWQNWGFLFDREGIRGYAPLMDFNHAFEGEMETGCLPERLRNRSVTQRDAAREALDFVQIRREADLSEFHYGEFVRERLDRLWG